MKRVYIKYIAVILAVIVSFYITEVIASAAENSEVLYGEILDLSGADELDTGSAGEYLDEYGLTLDDANSLMQLDISTVFDAVCKIASEKLSVPLRLFITSLGVIFLMAASAPFSEISGGMLNSQFRTVGVLVCTALVSGPVCECLFDVCSAVSEGADFLNGFVPVFASLTAFSGAVASAYAYGSAVLWFCGFAGSLCSNVLLELLSCCLALGIVDAASPVLSLGTLAETVKKLVISLLGFIMVVFVGMLSLQSVLSASADNLSARACKYIASSAIPIVGSAVSEAYSSISASVGVLRNATGVFGVIAVGFIVLPKIISAFLCHCAIKLAAYCSEAFGIPQLALLFKNMSAVISTALAVLISFFVMALISSAIVMISVGGIG